LDRPLLQRPIARDGLANPAASTGIKEQVDHNCVDDLLIEFAPVDPPRPRSPDEAEMEVLVILRPADPISSCKGDSTWRATYV
jgi:hypothetical protein